jgi:hypothetical protein
MSARNPSLTAPAKPTAHTHTTPLIGGFKRADFGGQRANLCAAPEPPGNFGSGAAPASLTGQASMWCKKKTNGLVDVRGCIARKIDQACAASQFPHFPGRF